MQVSRRLWRRDSISPPSTMRNLTNWVAHIESTHNLETTLVQSERMDPWEHEDRPSFGGSSQLPSTLRNRDHDQLLIWRWNSFMGDDCEWNKQIRNGNVGRNPREPHRCHWRQYQETCCESKAETNINADDFFSNGYCSGPKPF